MNAQLASFIHRLVPVWGMVSRTVGLPIRYLSAPAASTFPH